MLQARPLSGVTERHVFRERLLEQLPDSPGHVVWLHAPLGYGKSILAAQWAETLELDGWRILWTAMTGDTVQFTVASALRLPADAPWPVIHSELAAERTLLVIEDLQGDEDLEQLLQGHHDFLLLLASRSTLQEPELMRLRTQGRLLEFDAAQLAFNRLEAEALASSLADGRLPPDWEESNGWPLLLHFWLLTGSQPKGPLHVALRRSVSAEAWEEALFVAAAGMLPHAAATEATLELVKSGFLQELELHYRLHPLLAQHLLSAVDDGLRNSVLRHRSRLASIPRAQAAQRAGLIDLLHQELAATPMRVAAEQAEEYQRLAGELDQPDAAVQLRLAVARLPQLADSDSGARLTAALCHEQVSVGDRWHAQVTAAELLARAGDTERASTLLREAEASPAHQSRLDRLLLLVSRVVVNGYSGHFEQALADSQEAAELAADLDQPLAEQLRDRARLNMVQFAWQLSGDARQQVDELIELAASSDLDPGKKAQLHYNRAVYHSYNLEFDQALAAARECRAQGIPFLRLWADVMIAYLTGDVAAFHDLLVRARRWGMIQSDERVSALWLRVCRMTGETAIPEHIDHLLQDGPYVTIERALHQLLTGNHDRAAALLEDALPGYPEREFRQQYLAARFQIHGEEADLDELLTLSVAPGLLVRYVLLPLASLPRNRPQLSLSYPLQEVLVSGWREAIELRHSEIPPLELRLTGRFSVRLLGKEVQLPARQQQILALLALGYGRERIADEVWPEYGSARIANNLNVQMHSLRKALEPWGIPTYFGDGTLTNVDVDVVRLRKAISDGDPAAAMMAHSGDLLPEFDTPVLDNERESLRKELRELLMSQADRAEPATAVKYLERILSTDPLDEQALELLVHNLLRLGRRTAARRRAAAFRDQLLRETGLEPGAELLELLSD